MKEESNGISLPNSLESIHSPNSFSLWHDLARHGTISRYGERHGRNINTCRHRAKSCQMNRAKSCRPVVPNRAALQIN
ncbi:hypothetical protein [Phormidesmis priestleyi]|uniref:hypothetical protein n=1 Tax=Phormidesmis priestleyi TaxID=268141 RepID=UPI0012E8BD14|nr:hypothetical protein [Phormidesmis priestleyi]